ncbi:hypothetical protein CcaCcLH18_07797 [Colletotrichum camelliae]|nr:hypothetical protein CcaCcLH18_07797 [Colletotrichum camelliae]
MKFYSVLLFVASVAAVALDTDVPPELHQPGRRGVDCGACARLNVCPGKPNNNVELMEATVVDINLGTRGPEWF